MPWSSDLRGESKCTWAPSTLRVPSVCGCNPEMILMRVDLPAPLSPSTQVTSPAFTVRLTPSRARIAPYAFPTPSISTSGVPTFSVRSACSTMVSVMACSAPAVEGVVLDIQVQHDREQQHRAEEELEPVRVPAGEHDALGGHAEDERAHRGADRRAVPAGEQAAADDRGDDVEELVADALAGLHGVEREQRVHPVEPAHQGHAHEQADLHLVHRHPDRAGTG